VKGLERQVSIANRTLSEPLFSCTRNCDSKDHLCNIKTTCLCSIYYSECFPFFTVSTDYYVITILCLTESHSFHTFLTSSFPSCEYDTILPEKLSHAANSISLLITLAFGFLQHYKKISSSDWTFNHMSDNSDIEDFYCLDDNIENPGLSRVCLDDEA
jgi:hypothetical protein